MVFHREQSEAGPGLHAPPRSKPLRFRPYVRFASVYNEFSDVESFMDELKKLKKKHAKAKKLPESDT